MRSLIDTHCHTISSGHAYSTVQEYAREANNKGLQMIAITDHGPEMPGGPHIFHIANQRVIPEKIYGVEILKGVEANIMNCEGELDIPERILKRLDLVIASLHDVCITPGSIEENTKAICKAMENDYIDIIGHSGNPMYPIDKEQIVLKAKETNTIIEINNSSLKHKGSRAGSMDNCYEIAKLCKDHGVKIVLGSDAHISFDVGKLDVATDMLSKIGMPENLIMNLDTKRLKEYLTKKGKTRFMESTNVPTV
ncbi:phosphatase [Sporosalibacterium faouarense]|uniref:phosphatase n=1 Tax=Sporosalibacterium faouarense TaxID=516123 RepID=UPI00141D3499|nr:phosphatase [Sporosalibacterium faouarense]MTI47322.1 phosphatase [Bacillota bacterium]